LLTKREVYEESNEELKTRNVLNKKKHEKQDNNPLIIDIDSTVLYFEL